MKIAIHHRSGSFSDRWIDYCKQKEIPFKIVNCYDSNIISQLKDCGALMWHHHHANYKDVLVAKSILNALDHASIKVFPNFKTGWFFDDKVAQKYLLEAVNAPIIPSYVFYTKKEALEWVETAKFPLVWKLKGGASGFNVKLIYKKKDAVSIIKRAFSKGFSQYNRWGSLKERYKRYREGRGSQVDVLKGVGRLFYPTEFARMKGPEKGYVYFQKFIPGNTADNRIIIIDGKAFGVSRFIRKGDFKSSEFNGLSADKSDIDLRCVKIAFELSKKLKTQSLGIDFIFDEKNNPVIAEMGYGFIPKTYSDCPGYWDEQLNWHEGKFRTEDWMVESVIKEIKNKSKINQ